MHRYKWYIYSTYSLHNVEQSDPKEGTVMNEEHTTSCLFHCYDASSVALLISTVDFSSVDKSILIYIKYLRTPGSAKAVNQRIISTVCMCSNSIKVGGVCIVMHGI